MKTRTTWVLDVKKDQPSDLLVYIEGILVAIQNGGKIKELWSEPDKLSLALLEEDGD
jgi:hypothetical protein